MLAKNYFLGKRIAVIGIGPHGEMLSDIKYLVKANALVSVYDLRSESRLAEHIASLRSFGLANQVLGSIPADDLNDMDLIILSHDYPRDSSFLDGARSKGIDIEYPETLFLKQVPPVTVVGIMGSAGKSTVVSMLSPLLESICAKDGRINSYIVDFESEEGILLNLKRIKSGDIVILEIQQKMISEIVNLRWSPQVAVFTSVPQSTDRTKDANSIFQLIAFQTYNNYVIGNDQSIDAVRSSGYHSKAKMLRTKASAIPEHWLPNAKTLHDRENAALALEVARVFKMKDEMAEQILHDWKPLRNHLELCKKLKGIEFINDSASVTPAATIAGMSSLSNGKNIVLIFGGANRGADYRELYIALKDHAHTAIVLPGSGTMRERKNMSDLEGLDVISAPSIEEAVRIAADKARKGDKVLFSPAFDALGVDASVKLRGDRFVRAVKAL